MKISLSSSQVTQQKVNKVDQLFKMLEDNNQFKYEMSILCSELIDDNDEWKRSTILQAECAQLGIEIEKIENGKSVVNKKEIFEAVFENKYGFSYFDFWVYSHIGKVIRQFQISLPEFLEIGYTKLRFLAPVRVRVSDEMFERLLNLAKTMSTRELQKHIAKFLPKDGQRDIPLLPGEVRPDEIIEEEKKIVEKTPKTKKTKQVQQSSKVIEEITDKDIQEMVDDEDDNFGIDSDTVTDTDTTTVFEKDSKKVEKDSKKFQGQGLDETEESLTEKPQYKYLNLSFKKEIFDEIIAEGLKIAEELTGYVDNERKVLYIFMDFIALHQTSRSKIEQLKENVEKLIE